MKPCKAISARIDGAPAPQGEERVVKIQDCANGAFGRRLFLHSSAWGADWQLLIYGRAGHSSIDRSVDALGMKGFFHHESTDRRSRATMRDLLAEMLGRV